MSWSFFSEKTETFNFLKIYPKNMTGKSKLSLPPFFPMLFHYPRSNLTKKVILTKFWKKWKIHFFEKFKKICEKALLKFLFKRFSMYQDPVNVTKKKKSKKICWTFWGNSILKWPKTTKDNLIIALKKITLIIALKTFSSSKLRLSDI